MRRDGREGDILLLSTADWDHPYWTNKQHVAVELARAGRRVLYIDSLGLRAPRLKGGDLRRILRRLLTGLRPPRQVREGLWVCSPLRLPGEGSAGVRRVNRALLWITLQFARAWTRLRPTLLWTYSPLMLEQLDADRFPRVVYHAVDDISAQPDMPADRIRQAEAALARRADIVFATAPVLAAGLEAAGAARVHLLPNVADARHFGQALQVEPAADLAALPGPRIGFVGAVSGYKLDLDLVAAVAGMRPDYSFILVGPVGEGEGRTDLSRLRRLANVHLVGPRSYADLPRCLAAMDVAMLPAAANRYTAAMFPMKFFEYLAAGRPVVSTALPALEPYRHLAQVAPNEPTAFAAALDGALAGEGAPLQTRLEAAAAHTYEARTRRMLQLIAAL